MSKISIYETVPVPKLSDKLVGTSVGSEPENVTYNFTLSELLNLFIPNIPANTLQGVLDYGNTATQNINLTGAITTTTLNVGSTANILNSYLTGETHITGGLYDRLNSIGTAGQVLRSTGSKVEWYSVPTITPTLQQVLASGNTADINVLLDASLQANTVATNLAIIGSQLSVQGTLMDYTESTGTSGQVLVSNSSTVQWVDLPVYLATSPLHIDSITHTISIQKAGSTQDGYLSSLDWINFDGKQGPITLTTTGSSGASTFVGANLNIPNYTLVGLGGVPTSRTLTINGVTYDLSANRTWTITAGVSSVTATSPLFSSGGASPNITIQQSSSTLNGYLSSTDWSTFNNKQGAITLTTTGTSGLATLIGNTLNIPDYGSGVTGYVTIATAQTITGVKTFSPSVTAASLLAQGTIMIPTLTAAANSDVLVGLDVNPTFVNGAFTGIKNIGLRVGGASGLNYDTANQRLGIGTNAPVVDLDITKNVGAGGGVVGQFKNSNALGEAAITIRNDNYYAAFEIFGSGFGLGLSNTALFTTQNGVTELGFATLGSAKIAFRTNSTGSTNERLTIFANGNVGINQTTDAGYKLDVNGTARVQGDSIITTATNPTLSINSTGGGTTQYGTLYLSNANTGSNSQLGQVSFGAGSSTTAAAIKSNIRGGGNIGDLSFYTGANASLLSFVIANVDGRGYTGSGFGYLGYLQCTNYTSSSIVTNLVLSSNSTALNTGSAMEIQGPASGGTIVTLGKFSAVKTTNALATYTSDVFVSNGQNGSVVEGWRLFGSGNFGISVAGVDPLAKLGVSGSITAASAIARGVYFNNTLVAAANSDVLVGLDINPTFTNGAFTGLDNQSLRVTGTSVSATGDANGIGAAVVTLRNNIVTSGFNPAYILKLNRQNSAVASWYFGNDANNNGVIVTNNSSLRIGKDFGGTFTEYWRMFNSSGNFLLQNGGTFTDAGFRLDVNGTTRLQGAVTIPTSLSTGQILFSGVSSALSGNGNFSWYGYTSSSAIGLYVTPTLTAQSNLARAALIYGTLNAAANSDVLVGLDIQPTYTNGAFTGVSNYGLRIGTGTSAFTISTTTGIAVMNVPVGLNTLVKYGSNSGYGSGFIITAYGNYINSANLYYNASSQWVYDVTGYGAQIQAESFTGNIYFRTAPSAAAGTALGSAPTARMTITNGGNVLVGTTTDAGYKLDLLGTTRFQYGTIEQGFIMQHNNGNSAQIVIGNGSSATTGNVEFWRNNQMVTQYSGTYVLFRYANLRANSNTTMVITSGVNYGTVIGNGIVFQGNTLDGGPMTATSGTANTIVIGSGASGNANETWQPSSGTATYNLLNINPNINTSGTYAGIVRGLLYNPNTTSVTGVDHRAIETVKGNTLFGTTSGSVGIGATTTISASAILQVTSTTQGFLPPRMPTGQKTTIISAVAGLIVYDTTLNKLCVHNGSAWETITSV